MARAGLGRAWQCLFANDIDAKKGGSYALNWGTGPLKIADVCALTSADLPGFADLVWASFPCQDLSLAGAGAGLNGVRSGTFWPFWNLMEALSAQNRAPRIIALENVCGLLTSHDGQDFAALSAAFEGLGYRFGALVIDAVHFLPQSRPRLFIVGLRLDLPLPNELACPEPCLPWHTPSLITAFRKLDSATQAKWIWWRLPQAPSRKLNFSDFIEEPPSHVRWHSARQTEDLLRLMSDTNIAKVRAAQLAGRSVIGGVYKRTRVDSAGMKVQRAEVRFDNIAGCLRTPAGGSSRQTVLIVKGAEIRSRLLSPREAARLMGLSDTYRLPPNYNEAYHLVGDGVAVPVVRFLAEHIFEPLLANCEVQMAA